MSGGDRQHIAFPDSGGKALPRVRRVFSGMRPPIQVNGPLTVPSQEMHMERDEPLRSLIDFSPHADVPQTTQGVVGGVGTALVFLYDRDTIRVIAIGPHA